MESEQSAFGLFFALFGCQLDTFRSTVYGTSIHLQHWGVFHEEK